MDQQLNDENVCIICLEPENISCENIFPCDCTIYYHQDCIQRWVELEDYCPICKVTGDNRVVPPTYQGLSYECFLLGVFFYFALVISCIVVIISFDFT